MVDILVKLLLLQVTVADHRLQYAMIETDEERERAFIEGVLAALEFLEDGLRKCGTKFETTKEEKKGE